LNHLGVENRLAQSCVLRFSPNFLFHRHHTMSLIVACSRRFSCG
jgi:hypothetical protein